MKSSVFETTPAGFVARMTGTLVKLFVFVAEICQPSGGVMAIGAVRLVPMTVTCWFVEGFGRTVVNPENAVLLAGSISGVPAATTCPLTCTSALLVPPIVEFVMELVKEPTLAPDAMRTKTFVENAPPGGATGMIRLSRNPLPSLV